MVREFHRARNAGAAALVLGLWLGGPAGLAMADAPDDPSAPVSTGSQADATRPGAARTESGPREARADRAPRAAAGSGAPSARRTRESSSLPDVLPSGPTADTGSPTVAGAAAGPAPAAATATPRVSAPAVVQPVVAASLAPAVASRSTVPAAASVTDAIGTAVVRAVQFIDGVGNWLSGLPAPFGDFLSGALLLVRRTLFPGIPTLPVIRVGDVTVSEGGYGDPERADFAITLGAAYTDTVSVRYGTVPTGAADSAVPGLDYAPVSGTLVFTPGQTTAQVSVAVYHDDIADGSRTFRLEIYPGTTTGLVAGTALASGTATVTDDPIFTYTPAIAITELDSLTSPLSLRVDPTQQAADAIKATQGTAFTLTLPGPASGYTWMANKPALVDIASAGNQLTVTPKTPGFLGLKLSNGTADRYLGIYIADAATGIVPDTVTGYLPLGSVTSADPSGDEFLQDFNFRTGVAPIDYLYIYDQGGPDYTDGNMRGLLTQAVRHGQIPVVVFYNIQAVLDAAGKTGITEGYDSAYASINNFNYTQSGQKNPTMYTDFMKRYFQKMQRDFTFMNAVGVPVQVVVEPDFLGYMNVNDPDPRYFPTSFTPNPLGGDRSVNTAQVSDIYAAGLLVSGTDPAFANTITGLVEAINYYTAKNMPNLRLGWKTNIWSVPDQRFYSLGLLHGTDQVSYPFQAGWGKPIGFTAGQTYIGEQAAQLGAFLKKVGVTTWTGNAARAPFVAIDKYGVDGLYMYNPDMLKGDETAAFGDILYFVNSTYTYLANITDADTLKYFGKNKADFATFYTTHCPPSTGCSFPITDPDVISVWTAMQNASKADPNLAKWFFNADQWNNYLLLVQTLSTTLNSKVMLWQIPQGHVNGSQTLANTDLSNVVANFEDTATSYFFGDVFVATGGKLAHLDDNEAGDAGVRVSGNTITWDQHMTKAAQSGALSVLFGAGLGISTRGTPTPVGGVNDNNFWVEKATQYLQGVKG